MIYGNLIVCFFKPHRNDLNGERRVSVLGYSVFCEQVRLKKNFLDFDFRFYILYFTARQRFPEKYCKTTGFKHLFFFWFLTRDRTDINVVLVIIIVITRAY